MFNFIERGNKFIDVIQSTTTKALTNFVSIKVWIMIIATVLVWMNKIDDMIYLSIISLVVGLKEGQEAIQKYLEKREKP